MPNWFVYDNDGVKKGPVTSAQLKLLANSGKINQNTIIESENGHKGRAGQIKELFSSERPLESSLSENEIVPENQNKTGSDMTSKGSQEKIADNQQNSSENSKKVMILSNIPFSSIVSVKGTSPHWLLQKGCLMLIWAAVFCY